MKLRSIAMGLLLVGVGARHVGATVSNWAFAEGWFSNSLRAITNSDQIDTTTNGTVIPNLDSRSVAIWAAGNVNPAAEAPAAVFETPAGTASVALVQSAVGQMVAGPLGYPGAKNDLLASAQTNIFSGAAYRHQLVAGQPIGLQGGAFKIVFPGVPNTFGSNAIVEGDPTINYRADRIRDAEAAVRAALRLDPFDTNAAHSLLQTFSEQMFPLTFAGNSALVLASRSRLTGQNPALGEINNYATAISFFTQAAEVFRELTAYSSDAQLIEGQNPHLGAALTNDVSGLLDAFLRAVSQRADAAFQYNLRRYQCDYRDPTRPGYAVNTALLNDLDSASAAIRGDLLLASQFNFLPAFNFGEGSRVMTLLSQLARLRASITEARLIFVAGSSGSSSGTPERRYAEYTTDYVPFFAPDPNNPNQNNFDRAWNLANSFVNAANVGAIAQDDLARVAIEKVAINDYNAQTAQNDIRAKYEGELLELCGSSYNDQSGSPVPDIFFAALSPGQREQLANTVVTNGYSLPANNAGLIYQQWKAVDQAVTELSAARLELTNIFSEMLKRQEIENQISAGQRQIANLVSANGEKVVALDKEGGEIQAQLAIALGEIQAEQAEKQANNAFWGSVITAYNEGAVAAVSGNLGGLASIPGQTYTAMQNAYASAEAARDAGKANATAARRLADIQAQKDRISALERAQMQFEAANETDLRLAEALHSLALQAERQRLNIMLAMLKLDQESAKLASLFQRVSFLLAEYRRAVVLANQSPLLSPDYRLDRDAAVLRAEDAFVLAQQWCFVAAQAFAYRDNRPVPDSHDFVASVLAARNGQQLGAVLSLLSSANASLDLSYQSSPYATRITVSLRNDLLQNNLLVDDQVFTTNGLLDLTRAYSYEPTATGTNYQASDADWLQFLQAHVTSKPDGSKELALPFGLGLENRFQNFYQRNPLFDRTVFGRVIHNTDNAANPNRGVRINFVLRGTPTNGSFQGGSTARIRGRLSQEGLALIRSSAWACDTSRIGLRIFNDIPRFFVAIDGSINNIEALQGTDVFKERSPANTRWVIRVNDQDSASGTANNSVLIRNLALLKDIQFEFFVRGFEDQNCF